MSPRSCWIQLNGETHLKQNQVFRIKPDNILLLEKLVEEYIKASNNRPEQEIFPAGEDSIGKLFFTEPTGVTEELITSVGNQIEMYGD